MKKVEFTLPELALIIGTHAMVLMMLHCFWQINLQRTSQST